MNENSRSTGLDFSEVEKNLAKLLSVFSDNSKEVNEALSFTAEWVLGLAQNVAPVDQGTLGASANTVSRNNSVEFGFNTRYAAVQDLGFPGDKIVPRKKKALYVPISDKGKRYHSYGGNPKSEGLTYGIDYVLLQRVNIQKKPYKSKKGPNKYFSETLNRNLDKIFEVCKDQLKIIMDKTL